ncbi:MAG: glycosyltransferase family 4 protein [Candidatus Paceibacterota bacterium]
MGQFKVIHFSTVHSPSDVRIFRKQCVTLVNAGWDVTLVTAASQSDANEACDQSGVQLVILPPSGGRISRMTVTMLRMLWFLIWHRADIYHFHDPELLLIGFILRALGRRVIYDVHEDVPAAILNRHWVPPKLRIPIAGVANRMETLGGRWLSGVIGATPHIASRFPPQKTAVVQNYPVIQLDDEQARFSADNGVERVVFVGWISLERGIGQVVKALELVNQKRPVRLALAGNYHSNIAQVLEQSPGWQYVDFLGWQTRPQVAKLLASSRAGVVTFLPIPNHVESQPNKLFEYMSAGLPVIASDFPLWREFVGDRGQLVDPENPQAIADAMLYYLEHPDEARQAGERGRQAVQERFNWQAESRELIAIYDRVMAA